MEYGYEVVANSLVDRGVSHIFGLAGYANLAAVIRAVEWGGARYVSSRHEAGAVAMAAGYARATGKVGVATVTRGPAVTNTITALISAVRDRAPLVLYAGDSARDDLWNPQRIDQRAFVEPTGAVFLDCPDPARIHATVDGAFDIALHERRPVVVNIPADLVHQHAVAQDQTAVRPPVAAAAKEASPDPSAIEHAAQLLTHAQRPLILAGQGAVAAGAGPRLVTLAEAVGALVATTLPASGLFAGADFDIGFAGGYAVPSRQALVREADVVLAVGASLNPHTTYEGRLLRNATVIQCDRDPAAIGRQYPVDASVVADAAEAADALVAAVRARPREDDGYRRPEVAETIAASTRGEDIDTGGGLDGLDPRVFLRALDALLPQQRRVLIDIGHFATFACQTLTIDRPGRLLPCQGFAAVGQALPTSVGVATGCPDETVVAVVGDGGLLMALPELEVAARAVTNLIIVVLNDRAYGAEVHHARKFDLTPTLVQLAAPSLAQLAGVFGISGATFAAPGDLAQLPALLRSAGALLLDVQIDPAVIGSERYQHQPAAAG